MTLKEYIELLQKLPQDAEVAIDYNGYYEAEIVIEPMLRGDMGEGYPPTVFLAKVDARP